MSGKFGDYDKRQYFCRTIQPVGIMKKMFYGVMAAILVCSTSTFVSCSNDNAKLTSITLNNATLTLTVGQTETLKATTYPSDAADPSYTWSSNSTDVATVDATGKVNAVAVGTATISATAISGSGVKGVCAVTVTN